MFGYACYVDRYGETLTGVGERLDHLTDLGVTYLHLMPLLQPRPGDNDGGYAVMDYRSVRPDLGTNDDLRALATTLRGQRYQPGQSIWCSITLHVNMNGLSRRAQGDPRYRKYFHLYPDRDDARCVRAHACRKSFRTSRPEASRSTTSSASGCGRRSTSGNGI